MTKTNILIAVPAYGDAIRRRCVMSLLALAIDLPKRSIEHSFKTDDLSDVYAMRNVFASFVVQEPQFTHLLFTDSDIDFKPSAVSRMLGADRGVVACVYPRRSIDLHAALNYARQFDNATAISMASQFAYRSTETRVDRTSQPITVDGVGAGLMLIRRSVLMTMIAKVRKQQNHDYARRSGLTGPLYGFFDPLLEGDVHLPDDYSFCARYHKICGERVSMFTDENVGHSGSFTFRASPLISR